MTNTSKLSKPTSALLLLLRMRFSPVVDVVLNDKELDTVRELVALDWIEFSPYAVMPSVRFRPAGRLALDEALASGSNDLALSADLVVD